MPGTSRPTATKRAERRLPDLEVGVYRVALEGETSRDLEAATIGTCSS